MVWRVKHKLNDINWTLNITSILCERKRAKIVKYKD